MKDSKQTRRDLFATFLNLFWRLVSGPLLLLLIPFFLSDVQQGYWYLFSSLAALSVFADLGFSNIILQFSAHEYAYLSMGKNGYLFGDEHNIKKLGSFLRFIIKWLAVISLIVFPVILLIGVFFFIRDGVLKLYIIPWVIYSCGTLVNFFNNSILSYIEGMNQITKVQKARLSVAVINTVVIVLGLALHFSIFALAFAMLISSSYMFFTVFKTFGNVIHQIWMSSKSYTYPWRREILPLFKKYIVSFASGYFIFQIYTPLMHYFHGPIYSGKVGISLMLANAIFSFSNIWVYTITPKINMLVAKKEWTLLDKLFKERLLFSFLSYLFVAVFLTVFVVSFQTVPFISKISKRFLPFETLIILGVCFLFQLIINSLAIYLRGHKQEPLWVISLISAVWVFTATLIAGKYFGPEHFFLGLLSSYIFGIPVCWLIFRKKRREWHDGEKISLDKC